MRTILTAAVVLGAAALALAPPVQAQVSIRVPGVTVDTGPQPYWRQHHSEEWRGRDEFRDAQQQRPEWQHEHCVRDWHGATFCR
jgi:hypothetical protein